MKHCIVVTHGVVPLPCLERWRTLKTQKNPHHAPCPPKLNRTAVGLTRQSILFAKKFLRRRSTPGPSPGVTHADRNGSKARRTAPCRRVACADGAIRRRPLPLAGGGPDRGANVRWCEPFPLPNPPPQAGATSADARLGSADLYACAAHCSCYTQ